MASRCRSCQLLVPNRQAELPNPDRLSPIEPHLAALMDAAAEFDAMDDAPTTAVDFMRWISVDVQHAAGVVYARRRPAPRAS